MLAEAFAPPIVRVALPRLRLRISPAAQTALRKGHPWLYSDAIREQNREGKLGELAVIYDRNDSFLAVGLFEPESPIRVRLLHSGKPVQINNVWWKNRFLTATEKRAGLFDGFTNGFRWINGESDGWPGLVLDRFNTTLVLKLYTGVWLSRLPEIVQLILAQLQPGASVAFEPVTVDAAQRALRLDEERIEQIREWSLA